ncbi:MAG: hypothetical protein H0Z24_00165 [Thermosipho sp. (in: Bacteria)]|nr:hypothetical protein [Thermosipho sp. (in: thermotogales)]
MGSKAVFLIFFSIFLGLILGKLKIGKLRIGVSGTLFSGLFVGWIANNYFDIETIAFNYYFQFSLILFVSAVGLIASKDIKSILKKYGSKFIVLGFLITFSGFSATLILSLLSDINKNYLIGIFSGALTSSPGLASAIENTLHDSEIIFGYSIGYIPGVLAVILSIYSISAFSRSKLSHKPKETKIIPLKDTFDSSKSTKPIDYFSYSFIIIIGILIGNININLKIFTLSLGNTGGILISSLFFGSMKKLWKFNFEFDRKILHAIQNLGLHLFLSSIGLKSGYSVISTLNLNTLYIMAFSLVIALFSILIGLTFGYKILKIEPVILLGAITGGMTSTPGLAAAIDSTNNEIVIAGYGATYPFALIGMILFNKILGLIF